MPVDEGIKVEGGEQLKKRFDTFGADVRKRVRRAVNVNALEYQRAVKKSLRKRAGRYKAYKRGGKTHYSSKPGAPPNSDTGNLMRSIILTKNHSRNLSLVFIRARSKYAKPLEFGTRRAGRGRSTVIKARPFMIPALKKRRRLFKARILDAISGARGS